nr:zinc-ribbon domain-containing protein [Sporosarcina sp. E16_3]
MAAQWDRKRNKTPPTQVTPYSGIRGHWICEKGHEWASRVYSRTGGTMVGCPICSESKGERYVAGVLDAFEVRYEREYHFDGLYGNGGGPLRYDFVLIDSDGKVEKAIEYDGMYHFHKLFKDDGHELIVTHDRIKDEYCVRNGIPLLRIKYTEIDRIWTKVMRFIQG